jgi:hypothetical protein
MESVTLMYSRTWPRWTAKAHTLAPSPSPRRRPRQTCSPATGRTWTAYLDAVAHAQASTPLRPSIVNGQIAAALRGEFGDAAFTSRTAGSELFVNPLMAMYFAVDLLGLARSVGYLERLENTNHLREVSLVIENYREEVERKPRRSIPH